MTDGDTTSVRDRVANVVTTTGGGVLARVDILNHGLSVGAIIWLNNGRKRRSRGGKDGWRKGQSVKIGSLSCEKPQFQSDAQSSGTSNELQRNM